MEVWGESGQLLCLAEANFGQLVMQMMEGQKVSASFASRSRMGLRPRWLTNPMLRKEGGSALLHYVVFFKMFCCLFL